MKEYDTGLRYTNSIAYKSKSKHPELSLTIALPELLAKSIWTIMHSLSYELIFKILGKNKLYKADKRCSNMLFGRNFSNDVNRIFY